ncbi:MAG: leucyl/phenylalanyl-tRNA--protein transferase [Gemmataceae bacterium]
MLRLRSRGLPVLLTPKDPPTFPSPLEADSEGLIAIGGDLSPRRLLAAYRMGIFPWFDESTPILWWSPNPRGILELDRLHVSRRLERTMRGGGFRITLNQAFAEVIAGCADRIDGTWITPEMQSAYQKLHRLGHAHSLEVWEDDNLVGGIYGVAQGAFFAGESMFSRRSDASKIALVHLARHLRERGFQRFDLQILNPHTSQFGAEELPRRDYLRRLHEALDQPVRFV